MRGKEHKDACADPGHNFILHDAAGSVRDLPDIHTLIVYGRPVARGDNSNSFV